MQSISEGKSYLFNSLLSTRKILGLEDLPMAIMGLCEYTQAGKPMSFGACIVQITSGEVVNGGVVYNLELLVPIPGHIPIPSSFSYVPRLMIGNCVSLRYKGSFAGLGSEHIKLYEYLREHNLESVTGIYHIFERYGEQEGNMDMISADICIGTRKAP